MTHKNIMKFYIFILLFGYSSFIFSQTKGKIYGTVYYKNGQPVDMATVYIENKPYYAYTSEKGEFTIENIPYGNYKLIVKPVDKPQQSSSIKITSEFNKIAVRLNYEEANELEEVVVKGKTASERIKEKGFTIETVDVKLAEIQNIQVTELLNRSSGVKIRQSAGMGSRTQFNINGLTGNSIRIFIDGIPIRNYGRAFSLSNIPPSMIERIEVYKGVLPVELAEDALGGGINVVLKKQLENTLKTSYSFGSFNTHKWDVNGIYNTKNGLSTTFEAFYNYTDNSYEVWGDNVYVTSPTTGKAKYIRAKRFHDAYKSKGIKASVGVIGKKWADELRGGIIISDSDNEIQTGAIMDIVYGNRKTKRSSKIATLKYGKRRVFNIPLGISSFSTFSFTNRKVIDTIPTMYSWYGKIIKDDNGKVVNWKKGGGEGGAATLATNKEKHISNRTVLSYAFTPLQKLKASMLLNFSTRNIDDPYLSEEQRKFMDTRFLSKRILGIAYEGKFLDKKLSSSVFFKNYEQKVRLTEPRYVRFTNILEAVKHDKSINNNGYGLAFSYKVFPKLQVSISAEKAIRLPSFTELLGNTSDNIDPSYSLKPEKSNNINIGFDGSITIKKNHHFFADVNFFIRDVNDMIVRSISNSLSDTYAFENLGKIKSAGYDVELKYIYKDRLTLVGNLSSFDTRFNLQYDEFGSEYAYYKDRLRNNPFLTGNFNADYKFTNIIQNNATLSVNYNFGYTHWFYRNWESLGGKGKAIIPGYKVHDVSVSYQFPNKKVSLGVTAKNITDEQVFDNWALQKPGRAIFGKINYQIF